jgi:hypothetical protein
MHSIPQCWYKTLWKFVSSDEFQTEIEKNYQDLKTLRKKDVYIMQQFVGNGFVGKDLTSLNYVRKYLKAITLADIATSNGESTPYNAFEALKGNALRDD